MDSLEQGEELSQLARQLFDAAALKWYAALGLEVFASISSLVLSLLDIPSDWKILGALLIVIPLVIAYILRLLFDRQYGTAETMRRQSVLSEALGWEADRTQLTEWRRMAGSAIRRRAEATVRPKDYFGTDAEFGAPRLAEMTAESAFYTRHLYIKIRNRLWWIFGAIACALALAFYVALSNAVPEALDLRLAEVAYTIILIIVSVNLFGWALKLGSLVSDIKEVETSLERLVQNSPTLSHVMRLVSEYNCLVVQGFPILNIMFKRWHPDIRSLWDKR